ncbi:MAG: immunoglobulin-like domain-containing protein [Bacteroidia bacterium]
MKRTSNLNRFRSGSIQAWVSMISFFTLMAFTNNVYGENPRTPSTGFIENKGQIVDQNHDLNPDVKYLLNMPGLNVQLKGNSFSYDAYTVEVQEKAPSAHDLMYPGEEQPEVIYSFHRIDVEFIGANPSPQIIGEEAGTDYLHYYTTGTPEEGVTYVRHYGKVTYKNIYPGIDLEFLARPGTNKPVEYNFIVNPGADISQIKWRYNGSNGASISEDKIMIGTIHGKLYENIPLSYEKESNTTINLTYKALGSGAFGFNVPQYQIQHTLIIDPMPDIEWATYYGGTGVDNGFGGAATDAAANIFHAGQANSNTLATSGAHQTFGGGTYDAYLVKFSKDGTRLWCTYYGANGNETANGITTDAWGNVIIAGTTSSASTTNIATPGAHQASPSPGNEGFVARFNGNGIRQWGTYLGGSNNRDFGQRLATDSDGNVYFSAYMASAGLASTGAHQTAAGGGDDAIIAKFDSTGTAQWITYLGGNQNDAALAIVVNSNGDVYVAGQTGSSNNISSSGSYQSVHGGGNDAFLAKFNSSGVLQWSTYLGGSGADDARGIGLDASEDIYIGGGFSSSGFSTVGPSHQGDMDGYMAKFTPSGSLVWLRYLGGSGADRVFFLVTDMAGTSYVSGQTASSSGIATTDAYQETFGGSTDAFFAKFNSTGDLQWSSYFGGSGNEDSRGLTIDGLGNVIVTGRTGSSSGIATSGAFQTTYGGSTFDGYIAVFKDLVGENNAGTTKMTSPAGLTCSGNHDIKVEIVNAGIDTIQSVDVEWSVDGTAQSTVNVTTAINPGTLREVTLGNISFPANTTKIIKAWTSQPNNKADTFNTNDTIREEIRPGLSGTYTVGGTSPDYPDPAAAAADLSDYGMCGPVVFNLAAATFSGPVVLNQPEGNSSTNTISFLGAGKGATILTHAGTGTGDMATVMLNGADHVTFRDMTIENTGSTFGAGIWLTNAADSNHFINLDVEVDATSASNSVNGIIASGSATGISDGNTGSHNLFDSLNVTGGFHGIRLNGPNTSSSYAMENTISNSVFSDQYQFGVYLRSQTFPVVRVDSVKGLRNTSSYGVYVSYSANVEVANNVIEGNDIGIYLTYVNSSLADNNFESRIYNNMVSSTSDYGLYSANSEKLHIWHNSFSAEADHSTMRFQGSQTMDLRNNHIDNRSTVPNHYALHADALSTFSEMDYNNYYTLSSFVNIGVTYYANLPVLQAAVTQYNQNSSSRDPQFNSNTDLHTSINISGTYVGIDEDIDGDFRNTSAPVVGADEVNIPDNAGTTRLISPAPAFCAGSQDVIVQIGNYGINVINSVDVHWEVNGVAQPDTSITTAIALRGFRDINLGSVSFATGESKDIKVWTSMPNGITDPLRNNDTLRITVRTGLDGTYTVGGTAPDYADFSEAVFALNTWGVCGAVTFDVSPGTYNERLAIGNGIRGVSATNNITFNGAGRTSTNLSYSANGISDWATLLLNGTDHFTFSDMTISAMNANYGIGVQLTGGADSNTFRNVIIQTSTTSNSLDLVGIAIMTSTTDLYSAPGQPGDGNVFDSLEVTGGYYGIYLNGNSEHQVISNSVFTEQQVSSIYCSAQDYLRLSNNDISPLRNSSFSYSVNLDQISNFEINANTIDAVGEAGLYLQLGNDLGADPNFTSMIYNNMVSNTVGYAFYCANSSEISIYHNSFRSVGSSSNVLGAAYFSTTGAIDLRNNIIRNDNPNSYALYADLNPFDSMDYNNYYSFGNFVNIGTDYPDLSALRSGLPNLNQNSYSQDPQFVSLTNLHVSSYLPGEYVGVDIDIDGESRCPQNLSLGADEDGDWNFAKPVISTSHSNFFENNPLRFSNNIPDPQDKPVDYSWYIDGIMVSDSTAFNYAFTDSGSFSVKLVAENCAYRDSTTINIMVGSGIPILVLTGDNPDTSLVFDPYTDPGATATDRLGQDITGQIVVISNNVDDNVVGSYEIWYTVEDSWGNIDSAMRIVDVIDDEAPELDLVGLDTITIQVFGFINDPGVTTTDNYYKTVSVVVDSSTVDKNQVGMYTMTYTGTDSSGNSAQITRWVNVQDTMAPELVLIGPDTITVDVFSAYFEMGARVTDNYCNGVMNWHVDQLPDINVLGEYILTYSAMDCQNNSAIPVTRLVKVVDREAPVIDLIGDGAVTIDRWDDYADEGVTISDNYYEESILQGLLQTDESVNPLLDGTYSVCYEVTDPSGNKARKECRIVTVRANTTGVSESRSRLSIKAFPNPANGVVTLELGNGVINRANLSITDLAGRIVYQADVVKGQTQLNLDLTSEAEGMYLVRLMEDHRTTTIKLSIVKN